MFAQVFNLSVNQSTAFVCEVLVLTTTSLTVQYCIGALNKFIFVILNTGSQK